MALPTITGVALTDDDGSGTVGTILNNAWQTANIYTPINNLVAALVAEAAWVTYDASGASLVFTSVSGNYVQIGPLVVVTIGLVYPSIVSASGAGVGLPFASVNSGAGYGGGVITYSNRAGSAFTALVAPNSAFLNFWELTGAAVTNTSLSLKSVNLVAAYFRY